MSVLREWSTIAAGSLFLTVSGQAEGPGGQGEGLWQEQVLDADIYATKFVRTLPKSLRNRPDVRVLDLNGNGHDDLLITWKVGKKKGHLSIDGLTGSLTS
jgi:hypothetical protein